MVGVRGFICVNRDRSLFDGVLLNDAECLDSVLFALGSSMDFLYWTNILETIDIFDEMSSSMTSFFRVSRFLSRNPSAEYQTTPEKCLMPKSNEDIRGRA